MFPNITCLEIRRHLKMGYNIASSCVQFYSPRNNTNRIKVEVCDVHEAEEGQNTCYLKHEDDYNQEQNY